MGNWNIKTETTKVNSYFQTEITVTPPKVQNKYRAVHTGPEMREDHLDHILDQLKREIAEEFLKDGFFAAVVREKARQEYDRGLVEGRTTGGFYL